MANKSAKKALEQVKMQAANEVGVTLNNNGYNGDLTSRQAGSIGGQMVKKMIESYENSMGATTPKNYLFLKIWNKRRLSRKWQPS